MWYIDYEEIHNQLYNYLDGWYQYYDVPEIMNELNEYLVCGTYHITTIDDVDPDEFQDILQRWDKTGDDYLSN